MNDDTKPVFIETRKGPQTVQPIKLDYARLRKTERRQSAYLFWSWVVELAAIAAAFKLTYMVWTQVPAIVLFPGPILIYMGDPSWAVFFCYAALIQYPMYGIILDYTHMHQRVGVGWIIVVTLHVVMIAVACTVK